MNRSLID